MYASLFGYNLQTLDIDYLDISCLRDREFYIK